MPTAQSSAIPARVKNLIDKRYDWLKVVAYVGHKNGSIYWRCRCKCGRLVEVASCNLGRHCFSCGCRRNKNTAKRNQTHGLRRHPLYVTWYQMRVRCRNESCPAFKDYGGRGIAVCDRWQGRDGFKRFLQDMGPRPPGHSLDRRDNDGDYTPENCRWATAKTQTRNSRKARNITINGRTQCAAAWAEDRGIPPAAIYRRLRNGWSEVRAVFTPLFPTNRHAVKPDNPY